jgi:hypothetical protein
MVITVIFTQQISFLFTTLPQPRLGEQLWQETKERQAWAELCQAQTQLGLTNLLRLSFYQN